MVAAFNPLITPHLLQLWENGNFTLAALEELRKLKGPDSARIYWLLREYTNSGERTTSLSQLRFMLDIAETEPPALSILRCGYWTRPRLSWPRPTCPSL